MLSATQPTNLREGVRIAGKYVIGRWLGEGGMGSVYLAVHETTGKRVALKHIRDSSTAQARARFIREARAAARIHHPNVVDVYDVVEDDAGLFLVMEQLEGETLATRMRRDPKLTTHEAIEVTLDIARALGAAHREQVVHRDLKPANVFLADEDGERRIKVLDFGLAKILDEASSLSQSDHLVGTPHYMAPELVLGAVEARVEMDVYALGVILYELLAGVLPHDHERMTALLVDVATKPTPPLHTRAHVDRALSDVVMRALAKNPADRYASAAQFAEALRACALTEVPAHSVKADTEAPAAPAPKRATMIALSLLLVLMVPAALWWARSSAPSAISSPSPVASQEHAQRATIEHEEVEVVPRDPARAEEHRDPTSSLVRPIVPTVRPTPVRDVPAMPAETAEAATVQSETTHAATPAQRVETTQAAEVLPSSTSTPRAGTLSLDEF